MFPGNNLCIVLGANATTILQAVPQATAYMAVNEKWEHGLGTSIASGLAKLTTIFPQISAVMFMTVDQPFVTPEHLNAMIELYTESGRAIVASYYKDTAGIPAMFSQDFFGELLKLESDKGAKEIINLNANRATLLPLDLGEIDIDTPEQFAALTRSENP